MKRERNEVEQYDSDDEQGTEAVERSEFENEPADLVDGERGKAARTGGGTKGDTSKSPQRSAQKNAPAVAGQRAGGSKRPGQRPRHGAGR